MVAWLEGNVAVALCQPDTWPGRQRCANPCPARRAWGKTIGNAGWKN